MSTPPTAASRFQVARVVSSRTQLAALRQDAIASALPVPPWWRPLANSPSGSLAHERQGLQTFEDTLGFQWELACKRFVVSRIPVARAESILTLSGDS